MVEQGSHNPRVGSSSLPAATSSPSAREARFTARIEGRVARALARACGVGPGDPVVLALSGGPDSATLLALLVAIRGRDSGSAPVVAAHLNHRLRGAASDRDALFAAATARASGVACVVGEPADPIGTAGNLEAGAREERYTFLCRVAQAVGARTCVAHTRDDQAETVLLRLARGAGARGLAAMAARRDDGVVRPLLDVSREDLRRYAGLRAVASVVDVTNEDARRLRSRVRHEVLPGLSLALGVDATERLARLADELRVESTLAEIGVASLLDALASPTRLPVALLASDDASGRVVHSWLVRAGLRPTRAQVQAVVAVARSGRPGGRVDLAGGARVERRYGEVVVTTSARAARPDWGAVELPVPGGVRAGGRWWIESRIEPEGFDPAGGGDDPFRVVLSSGDARLPLRVRPPRPGDRMRLSRGGRKLSDLLVDAKVPRSARSGLALVVDAEDAVLWVPGVPGAVRGGRRARGDLGLVARLD